MLTAHLFLAISHLLKGDGLMIIIMIRRRRRRRRRRLIQSEHKATEEERGVRVTTAITTAKSSLSGTICCLYNTALSLRKALLFTIGMLLRGTLRRRERTRQRFAPLSTRSTIGGQRSSDG